MSNGLTPYQQRFGEFKGLRIPFGAECQYVKFDDNKADKAQPIGPKTHKGIFAGYDTHAGGKWSGDYWIIDATALHEAEAIRNVQPVRVKVISPIDIYKFPVKSGAV